MASATSEYLFLMRGANWDKGMSPNDVQNGLEAMGVWLDGLKSRGLLKGGQPLAGDGGVVSHAVMDGPFVETKEAVGGYLLIEATSLEEAMEAARACPVLQHGLFIEVRPIISDCHMIAEYGLDMSMSSRG
jgi:hypothetical protein